VKAYARPRQCGFLPRFLRSYSASRSKQSFRLPPIQWPLAFGSCRRRLAAVAIAIAAPAHANQTIIRDNDPGFVKLVEIWHTAALHRPTFKTRRWCSLSHICETVEFAVRDDGKVADTFIYPDKAPKDVIWCTVSSDSPNVRYCQKAAGPGSVMTWFEAYFPHAGEYREISYGENAMDPACKSYQHSEYDIDESYVDCVVGKGDAAPKE
jgi:hypothetical protein